MIIGVYGETKGFTICTHHLTFSGQWNQEGWDGQGIAAHMGNKTIILSFGWKISREKSFGAHTCRWIMLKWMLEKLHNEELHNFYTSPNVIMAIKSRIRWPWHAACMESWEVYPENL